MSLGRWTGYVIVFVSSFCTLVLELVAGRILAPYIGVSLYTWTSIIGVVLAGISLGNYVGGRVADRWASPRTLGVILLAGGLASLLVLLLVPLAANRQSFRLDCGESGVGALGGLCGPLLVTMARILGLTTAIFFLPGFVLGMVSPVVVRLSLSELGAAGATVGRIYACSTLGSIVGTFLTGFWLVSAFGTRQVVFGVALTLVGLAASLGQLWRIRRPLQTVPAVGGAAALAFLLSQVSQRDALATSCYRETDYFCIRVYGQSIERDQPLWVLQLDHLVHSYNAVHEPTYYEYSYIRIYAELTDYVVRRRPGARALFIGGGGYTLPRGMEVRYPETRLEVIEIDPGVTRTVYEKLGLRPDSRIVTYNLDARLALEQLQAGPPYDLVYGDAFNDISVPYHLTTLEFDRRVRGVLSDDGLYMVNVIDRFRGGKFLASFVRTMREVFPHVYVASAGIPWKWLAGSPNTYVVVGAVAPIDEERLKQVEPQGFGQNILTNLVPAEVLAEWIATEPSVLLTDDYAPADNLVAPLFAERSL